MAKRQEPQVNVTVEWVDRDGNVLDREPTPEELRAVGEKYMLAIAQGLFPGQTVRMRRKDATEGTSKTASGAGFGKP